jgi:hypothetical protein
LHYFDYRTQFVQLLSTPIELSSVTKMSLAAYDTDSVIRLAALVVLLSALLAAGVKFFSTSADSSKRQTPPIVDLLTRYTPVQDAVLAQLEIADIIIAGTFAYDFMARKPFDRTAGKRQLDGLLIQAGPNAYALHFFLVNDGFKSLDEPIPGISVGQCVSYTNLISIYSTNTW